jgi:transcriptional regulator with XRE-family HTH domain
MTNINNKIELLKNNHTEDTMANLSKLLKANDISQVELAKELGKDKTTINRWVKNSREVAWENATEIAKVLKCHPVDIYKPKSEFILKYYIGNDFYVKFYNKDEQFPAPIPFEWNHKNIKGIHINIPGTFLHREIFLFDMPERKKHFDENAINKFCYLKRSNGKKNELLGVLKPNKDSTLQLVNPLNGDPVNKKAESFSAEDILICVPVKAKYNADAVRTKKTK